MSIPIYVINLASSTDRWHAIGESAQRAGVSLVRVPAVDGRLVKDDAWTDFDREAFLRWHGRVPLATEYGCYMSHLAALDQIIANGDACAVILEDDARFEPGFKQRLEAIAALGDRIGVVKLFNHRARGFVSKLTTSTNDRLGRCLHGPLGSALGYVVTQAAAQALRQALRPMRLPYDIALGRFWTYDVPFHACEVPLVRPDACETATTIATRDVYRQTKLPLLERVSTLRFRTRDYLCGAYGAWARL